MTRPLTSSLKYDLSKPNLILLQQTNQTLLYRAKPNLTLNFIFSLPCQTSTSLNCVLRNESLRTRTIFFSDRILPRLGGGGTRARFSQPSVKRCYFSSGDCNLHLIKTIIIRWRWTNRPRKNRNAKQMQVALRLRLKNSFTYLGCVWPNFLVDKFRNLEILEMIIKTV